MRRRGTGAVAGADLLLNACASETESKNQAVAGPGDADDRNCTADYDGALDAMCIDVHVCLLPLVPLGCYHKG